MPETAERPPAGESGERFLQERLLEFSRTLGRTVDPAEVAPLGLAALGEGLGLDRVYLRLVEGDLLAGVGAQWCRPGLEPLRGVATPGSMDMLQHLHARGAPLVVNDVRDDPFYATEAGRSWQRLTGAHAALTAPVAEGDVPVGVVTCIQLEPRRWTQLEAHWAQAVAGDLGRALVQTRVYAAQAAAVARLEQLDRAKDEFLAAVSHELRTPLTNIAGYLELLTGPEGGAVSSQQRWLLGAVDRNTARLTRLVEDLLAISEPARSEPSASGPVHLGDVCAAVVEEFSPAARDLGVELDLTVDGSPTVPGDPGQVLAAVRRVVDNGVKFTPAGGSVRIAVTSDSERRWVSVEVRDTGIGVPADEVTVIPARFFRARNAVAAQTRGAGMGLAIVDGIVRAHGGNLRLRSDEGVGTTVTLTLPAGSPDSGDTRPTGGA